MVAFYVLSAPQLYYFAMQTSYAARNSGCTRSIAPLEWRNAAIFTDKSCTRVLFYCTNQLCNCYEWGVRLSQGKPTIESDQNTPILALRSSGAQIHWGYRGSPNWRIRSSKWRTRSKQSAELLPALYSTAHYSLVLPHIFRKNHVFHQLSSIQGQLGIG